MDREPEKDIPFFCTIIDNEKLILSLSESGHGSLASPSMLPTFRIERLTFKDCS